MRMPRPATPTATPIHANTESVVVTPTPDVLRTNGPTNATTYATTIKRVLDRSSSPPCQLRASVPLRSATSRRSHAASRRLESHSVIDGHRLPESRCRTAFPVSRHEPAGYLLNASMMPLLECRRTAAGLPDLCADCSPTKPSGIA